MEKVYIGVYLHQVIVVSGIFATMCIVTFILMQERMLTECSVCTQMYEEIRNRHFSNVSSFLSEKARALQTGYDVSLYMTDN